MFMTSMLFLQHIRGFYKIFDEYMPLIRRTKLFAGVGEAELASMMNCLSAVKRVYPKGSYVFHEGEHLRHLALLTEGKLHVQKDDYWGNHSIVNIILPGDLFGEAYAAPDSGPLLNDVVAVEDSVVLLLDFHKMMTVCSSACQFHSMVIQNLFLILSARNRHLTQKLGHMAQRTTREKLLSYLSEESKRNGSPSFDIPFNRQQLADFLAVDRSAMSGELGRMRDDGLLTFDKNHFTLL